MTGQQLYEMINEQIKIGCAWQYLSPAAQNKWAALALELENKIIIIYDLKA
jgi:hypothetical protein